MKYEVLFYKLLQKKQFNFQKETEIHTPQTGTFFITSEAFLGGYDYKKKLKEKVHIVQAAILEKGGNMIYGTEKSTNECSEYYMSFKELLDSVVIPKNPIEKMDKLLTQFEKETNGNSGNSIDLNLEEDFTRAYAVNDKEFGFLLECLEKEGYVEISWNYEIPSSLIEKRPSNLITNDSNFGGPVNLFEHGTRDKNYPKKLSDVLTRDKNLLYRDGCSVNILLNGWKRIEKLKTINKNSKQGFIACWFNAKHVRYSEAIVRGIKRTKIFEPMIIRDKDYPETILAKGLGEIKKSRFLIADLTGCRPSVIFEAGFAFGLGLEVVFVMKEDEFKDSKIRKEFYTKSYKIISYKDEKELEESVFRVIVARINLT